MYHPKGSTIFYQGKWFFFQLQNIKTQEILMLSYPITGIQSHVMLENVNNKHTCLIVSEIYKM